MKIDARLFAAGLIVLGVNAADAQNYPNKPIRMITTGVGSVADTAARLIGNELAGSLGQQIIVDNRAAGVTPGTIAAKAAPDGYTLLLYGNPLWLAPFLQDKVPYDPVRDFAPVTMAIRTPTVLVVNPALPVRSVRELTALAKAQPGMLNYGSAATGSTSQLAAVLFKSMAHVDVVFVPYKAAAAVLNDLMSGQIQFIFGTGGSVMPHVKSGRLRALAVTSAKPTALVPGVPTVAESGLAGYEMTSSQAVFAPTGTPAHIVNRLNAEIVKVLDKPGLKEKFFNLGVETVGDTPAECAAAIKHEMSRLGKVIADAGIRSN